MALVVAAAYGSREKRCRRGLGQRPRQMQPATARPAGPRRPPAQAAQRCISLRSLSLSSVSFSISSSFSLISCQSADLRRVLRRSITKGHLAIRAPVHRPSRLRRTRAVRATMEESRKRRASDTEGGGAKKKKKKDRSSGDGGTAASCVARRIKLHALCRWLMPVPDVCVPARVADSCRWRLSRRPWAPAGGGTTTRSCG